MWLGVMVLWTLGCSGGEVIDERTPLEAPDADWMVSISQGAAQQQVWTAYSVGDQVEAAAGKGAVPVDRGRGEAIERALEAFLADEGDVGPVPTSGGATWTFVLEHDGRRETVVMGELDPTATALFTAVSDAVGGS